MRSTESLVEKEEPEFKVDLRIEGIAQDVILEDEERMGHMQKVKEWYYELDPVPNQLLKIWEKPEKSINFSEESSRTIHELGNIELHELGQISRTVQCQSCLQHTHQRD